MTTKSLSTSKLPRFRDPYNYDTDLVSFSSGLDCSSDPSRTQQHMADETDINKLVATYARTGIIPGSDLPAMEFHVDEIFDYQTAMNQLIASNQAFMALPSNIRDRFHNDPAHLLDFVSHENNRDEAIRLGLIPEPPPAQPVNAPVPEPTPPVN